ncbi:MULTISPECIES: class I SAM-dependent methyltransferase [unclassified Sphingopyxis]|uniref:class I SAM-dependent methyltransferase n=1 Tax=unclassified Sphingopyxis TaxID=2614943 RepID=UPI000736E9A3|nr:MULTISPECIES: class I SAM-dependent methyltransferase [unclassified Sphingopyxis]KTE27747.1 SAM-dependent methyltransferase [Sphingopyxis sp. HIX]KTE76685.1 SAM-dependent methyltransferase [Sphingopyxis sp. HXXIV]
MVTAPQPPTHEWTGASGHNWVLHQQRLDLMLKAFGDAAIDAAAIAPGEQVLDIGCGAGATSFALAEKIGPGGQVLGVDISPQLVARAEADTPAGTPAAFRLADAATAALPPASFDLLFSRFGVMFFDDPAAAFAHMRAALKPDGRLAFACWRAPAENDWIRLPMAAIRDFVSPPPVDPLAPGPFAFADRGRIEAILSAAGFADVAVAPFDATIPYGAGATREAAVDDALTLALAVGPLSRALADQPGDIRAKAAAAVRAAFAQRPGETSILIDGAAWVVTARAG